MVRQNRHRIPFSSTNVQINLFCQAQFHTTSSIRFLYYITMKFSAIRLTVFGLVVPYTQSFGTSPSIESVTHATRRDWIQRTSFAVISGIAFPAFADETTAPDITPKVNRMGGLLEKFQDGPRGFRMLAPSGWNKFEGEVGTYDVMWRDLVDTKENVKVSSSPVKSTTTSV